MDHSVTDHLLSTTRSVRKRLDLTRPVEPEIILECLELATQAPTPGNRQTWRWVVVTDAAKRARIGELYKEVMGDRFSQLAKAEDTDPAYRRLAESADYLVQHLHEVPVHVIPCVLGRVDGMGNDRAAGFYGAILPAAWSFMLALRSRGLGSAWTSALLTHEEEIAELLGIPSDVSQTALLPVAYTIGTDFRPGVRVPVEQVTYWNTWETGR